MMNLQHSKEEGGMGRWAWWTKETEFKETDTHLPMTPVSTYLRRDKGLCRCLIKEYDEVRDCLKKVRGLAILE